MTEGEINSTCSFAESDGEGKEMARNGQPAFCGKQILESRGSPWHIIVKAASEVANALSDYDRTKENQDFGCGARGVSLTVLQLASSSSS